MIPKQKNTDILENIEIFYISFWKEVKQIIIITILILIRAILKILGKGKANIKY